MLIITLSHFSVVEAQLYNINSKRYKIKIENKNDRFRKKSKSTISFKQYANHKLADAQVTYVCIENRYL